MAASTTETRRGLALGVGLGLVVVVLGVSGWRVFLLSQPEREDVATTCETFAAIDDAFGGLRAAV